MCGSVWKLTENERMPSKDLCKVKDKADNGERWNKQKMKTSEVKGVK